MNVIHRIGVASLAIFKALLMVFALANIISCESGDLRSDNMLTEALPVEDQLDAATGVLPVEDQLDAAAGVDIVRLDGFIGNGKVTIKINTATPNAIDTDSIIYLYGTNNDLVRINNGAFEVNRDPNGDGWFEQIIYDGSTTVEQPDALRIDIPIDVFPDANDKTVWLYSMEALDRVPEEGGLHLRLE